MSRAFTLLELLVVVAIMGLLGTVSVGGYRAMQRGMEERGVMDNVNMFIRAAYQRAQIDRQPVFVYFWNETLRKESDDGNESLIVVGKAVAVRRAGRVTKLNTARAYLFDEFADLRFNRAITVDGDEDTASENSDTRAGGVNLYQMKLGETPRKSVIAASTRPDTYDDYLLFGGNVPTSGEAAALSAIGNASQQVTFQAYAYHVVDGTLGEWQVGDPYGFEFAELQLPKNFIFGRDFSRDTASPVRGQTTLRFKVGLNANASSTVSGGFGDDPQIEVYSLRPDESGELSPLPVAKSKRPDEALQ